MIIRKEQIEKLNNFLEGGTSNPIMEMIMGSGKSKVLLPLSGLLRADGKALSMLIVPAPLFESNSSDVHSIFKTFSKSLCTLQFDRNSILTYRSLEEIRDTLKNVIENKDCVIMTSKSIQSLLLKFIELVDKTYNKGELQSDEMLIMQEILGLISTCGNPLIDEADTVLNVLHEVSFSIGNKSSPKQLEIDLIGEIYSLLYTDPTLKAIAKLESDPEPSLVAPPLTQEIYYNSLQKPLTEALITKLRSKNWKDPSFNTELKQFFTTMNGEKYQQLFNYLTRNISTISQNQLFFTTLPPILQEIFSLIGEEVSHLLQHTLIRTSDENYGLDQDVLAIPYAAVSTPSRGSLFSNPYITMNYTFQIHLKNKISKQIVEQQVLKLEKQATREMAEDENLQKIDKTKAWKVFCFLKGDLELPLFQLNDSQLIVLTEQLNSSINFKKIRLPMSFFLKWNFSKASLPAILLGLLVYSEK